MSSADLASALPAHGAWLIPIVAMYLGYRIRMRIQKLRERIVEQKPTDDASSCSKRYAARGPICDEPAHLTSPRPAPTAPRRTTAPPGPPSRTERL